MRRYTEHVEKAAGRGDRGNSLRRGRAGEIQIDASIAGDRIEQVTPLLEREHFGRLHAIVEIQIRGATANGDDTIETGSGEWPEQYCVHCTDDDGGRANREGQGTDDGEGEHPAVAQ